MEEQLGRLRSEMLTKRLEGSSGNGLVRVEINGNKELVSLQIQPQCVDPQDVEGLQDLILAACQDAYGKVEEDSTGSLSLL